MKVKRIIIFLLLIITFCLIIPNNSMAVIYKEPAVNQNGTDRDGLDDMIDDARRFENQEGNSMQTFELNDDKLKSFSSSLYSVLLIAATAVSVVVGLVIGIKYLVGSVEQKAEYKKLLLPYVAGCIVVYGSLGIWKLVVTMLGNI